MEALGDSAFCSVSVSYDECFMTFNVHQLLHLGTCVENLGPLWACSAFPFEPGNGKIMMVKAAKGAPFQIVERVVVHEELELILHSAPRWLDGIPSGQVAYYKTRLGQ